MDMQSKRGKALSVVTAATLAASLGVPALAVADEANGDMQVAERERANVVDGMLVGQGDFAEGVAEFSFDGGTGTAEDPYLISSIETLKGFRDSVNAGNAYAKKFIKLTKSIDLENEEWAPIGTSKEVKFEGVFDGGDCVISNLKISAGVNASANNANKGFFGYTANGEVKNLVIHNAQVTGGLEVGVFAGTPYTSKMTNLKLTGDVQVKGYSYVGGMFGKGAYADLTDLVVDVKQGSLVSAESGAYRTYVGGVVGFMGEGKITVSNVRSNISVAGSTCDVGGIAGIGHYGNTFKNCIVDPGVTVSLTSADAESFQEIGGIIGVWMNSATGDVTLEDCQFNGSLFATGADGGDYTSAIAGNALAGAAYYAPSENTAGQLVAINGGVTTIVPGSASGIKDMLTNIQNGQTVKLSGDAKCDVVISEGVTATIDLAGHKITNETGDTISVENGANLTVIDTVGGGVVDNRSHGKAAVYNSGTVFLEGGLYDRTSETGQSADISGGNSWYTICNHGSMTVADGVSVKNTGGFSSMFENGYQNYGSGNERTGHVDGVNASAPSLTIEGGVFEGGLNAVKNDDGGNMVINGGKFSNTSQAAVLNWNVATINGGEFSVSEGAIACLLNGASSQGSLELDKGKLFISGGSFIAPDGVACVKNNITDTKPAITGGTFSSNPSDFVSDGYVATPSNGKWVVSKYVAPAPPAPQPDTEVEQRPDGSTVTTVTKPDGSQTVTTEAADGSRSVVSKDADGNVTSTEVSVSDKAAEAGEVVLPLDPSKPAADAGKAPAVEVKVPASVTAEAPVKVTVPVDADEPDYGVVVFAVDADGNETVLPKCGVDADGNAVFEVTGDVTIKVVDAASEFPDVAGTWYGKQGVADFVSARGILTGVPQADGALRFEGDAATTRAMFVTMLHRAESCPDAPDAGFADAAGLWFEGAAAWGEATGVVDGYGGSSFGGDDSVTREQMAVFLMRYAEHLGLDTSARADLSEFPDGSEASPWASQAMSWAVAEGLFSGRDGLLDPTDGATRAEASAVVMRFINGLYA